MEIDTIIQYLIAIIPSIVSVIGIIGAVIGFLRKVKRLKESVDEKTDCRELQKTIAKVVDENQQLRKEINTLRTRIDHVNRG